MNVLLPKFLIWHFQLLYILSCVIWWYMIYLIVKKCALCLDPLYLKYRNVFLLTQRIIPSFKKPEEQCNTLGKFQTWSLTIFFFTNKKNSLEHNTIEVNFPNATYIWQLIVWQFFSWKQTLMLKFFSKNNILWKLINNTLWYIIQKSKHSHRPNSSQMSTFNFYLSYDGKARTYSQYAWIYRRVWATSGEGWIELIL